MNARLMMYNWALLFMVRLPVLTSTCWQTCSHLCITNILTSLDDKWHHECIVVFKLSLTVRLRGHKQGIEWACLFMFIVCVIWASRTKTAGKCMLENFVSLLNYFSVLDSLQFSKVQYLQAINLVLETFCWWKSWLHDRMLVRLFIVSLCTVCSKIIKKQL